MSARSENYELAQRIRTRTGKEIGPDDANTLRRAEKTLHRWAERECGDGSDWYVSRDEETGKPFNVYHGPGKPSRHRIPDLERGALRRVAEVCKRLGLYFFHQTDPRGCALYVSDKPITDRDYTGGCACCVD